MAKKKKNKPSGGNPAASGNPQRREEAKINTPKPREDRMTTKQKVMKGVVLTLIALVVVGLVMSLNPAANDIAALQPQDQSQVIPQ